MRKRLDYWRGMPRGWRAALLANTIVGAVVVYWLVRWVL